MKLKANYKLQFEPVKKKYKKYRKHHELSRIILNDYLTKYYIRSDGTVFSSNYCKDGELKKRKINKIKNAKDKDNPYYVVHLSVKNKSYTILVHRLVAGAFIDNPENKPEVNHKNGRKRNNKVNNLEWNFSSENIFHSYESGIRNKLYGEDKANSKITNNQAHEICKLLEENKLTMKEISELVGCSKATILNIRQRKAWINISSEYNIDNYDIRESTNGNKRLKKETAKNICKDIESGYFSIRDIATKYNIPYSKVNDIKQRKTWTEVSKNYDFSNYKKFAI